jgi:hypothetical protein
MSRCSKAASLMIGGAIHVDYNLKLSNGLSIYLLYRIIQRIMHINNPRLNKNGKAYQDKLWFDGQKGVNHETIDQKQPAPSSPELEKMDCSYSDIRDVFSRTRPDSRVVGYTTIMQSACRIGRRFLIQCITKMTFWDF